jgi:hypothetical protein
MILPLKSENEAARRSPLLKSVSFDRAQRTPAARLEVVDIGEQAASNIFCHKGWGQRLSLWPVEFVW